MAKEQNPFDEFIERTISMTVIEGGLLALTALKDQVQVKIHELQASKGYTVGSGSGSGSSESTAEPPKRRKRSGKPLSEAHRAAISKSKKDAAVKQKARWVGEHPPTAPEQIGEEPAGAQSLSELTSKSQ